MKKKLNEKQEAESLFIKEWCLTIIDFIYSKYEADTLMVEMHKETLSDKTKQRYLNELSPTMYIKGLRMAYNDTNEWAKDLPQTILEDLNKILRNRFGKDLNTYSKDISKQISKIIKRGKIIDDDEFKSVDEKVNEICQTSPKSPEIDVLNKLLLAYHEKKKDRV